MAHLLKSIVVCMFFLYAYTESAVLIADFAMSRMVELFAKRPFCKLHTDRGDIQRMLLNSDPKRARQVPRENVLALEQVCSEAGGLSGELQGGLGFIYPGTKWCGPGTLASEYNDVGRYADEDRCCREHDHCPNTLSPGECKRGLCNSQSFTRSHCDCDIRFRRCLQGLNTEVANTLGAVFFNVVQLTCFKERRPCSVYQSFIRLCPAEFVVSDFYTSLNRTIQIKNDLFFDTVRRSINNEDSNFLYNNNEDPALKIQLASYGLIAKNLFNDVVVRQIQGLYQLYATARNILNN